jgi:acetolactate synthase small subunit
MTKEQIYAILAGIFGLILNILKPSKLTWRQITYRAIVGLLAIPVSLTINQFYNIGEIAVASLTSILSLVMFIIVEKIEEIIPEIIESQSEKLINTKK